MVHSDIITEAEKLINSNNTEAVFAGTQALINYLPPTFFIENYLEDNGKLQNLAAFPLMVSIYNKLPKNLLLKCSRKTLKSTLISNIICLNSIRWNYYHQMYVGPQESTVKYFSFNYLYPRFRGRKLKNLIKRGFIKDDVFEKILKDTNSSCLLRYCSDDASRIRGPAVDHIYYDEIQDIYFDQLPIIKETTSMSEYVREFFSGTPLSSDNTIDQLWQQSNMLEWVMKCPSCNHWNSLTADNNPLKMILPAGLSCSKCGHLLDSETGQWASFNPAGKQYVGYHLAQPIIPFYNKRIKKWTEVYDKVTNGRYSLPRIYNEVFGLSYDIGAKPINKEELMRICVLGRMRTPEGEYEIIRKNKSKYHTYSIGVDWGVNGTTSRTAYCLLALTSDGYIDCVDAKIYNDYEYDGQIRAIARVANDFKAKGGCDAGPDPARGIALAELTSPTRMSLIRYEHGKLIQRWDQPSNAFSWKSGRWVLHRSDTLSLVFKFLKSGKLRFPNWECMSEMMQDILNENIETRETDYRQEMFYRHSPDKPDDFLHALNFALCTMLMLTGDVTLEGPSTSYRDFADA